MADSIDVEIGNIPTTPSIWIPLGVARLSIPWRGMTVDEVIVGSHPHPTSFNLYWIRHPHGQTVVDGQLSPVFGFKFSVVDNPNDKCSKDAETNARQLARLAFSQHYGLLLDGEDTSLLSSSQSAVGFHSPTGT